ILDARYVTSSATLQLLPARLDFFATDPAPPEIYTLSLHDALPISGSDRSRLHPPSAVRFASRARILPSSVKPTLHEEWKPWRLPVIVISHVRSSRRRTGRPVSLAPSAATAA